MERVKELCRLAAASGNSESIDGACSLYIIEVRKQVGLPEPRTVLDFSELAAETAQLRQLYAVALASGDAGAMHGVSTLILIQARKAKGLPVPEDPVEFAKFVVDTAPPEAQPSFKGQADAIKDYEAGKIAFAELRARLS